MNEGDTRVFLCCGYCLDIGLQSVGMNDEYKLFFLWCGYHLDIGLESVGMNKGDTCFSVIWMSSGYWVEVCWN